MARAGLTPEVEDASPGEWGPRDSETREKKERKGTRVDGLLVGCVWSQRAGKERWAKPS